MQLKWLLLFVFTTVCACVFFSLTHLFRPVFLYNVEDSLGTNGSSLWKRPPLYPFYTHKHTHLLSHESPEQMVHWSDTLTHTRRHTLHEWTASLATLLLFWSGCGGRDHTRPVVYHILYTHWVYWPTDPAWLCACTCMCAQCIGFQ